MYDIYHTPLTYIVVLTPNVAVANSLGLTMRIRHFCATEKYNCIQLLHFIVLQQNKIRHIFRYILLNRIPFEKKRQKGELQKF